MMNVKPVPAIALLITFSLLVWVVLGNSLEADEAEATEDVYFTIDSNEPNEPEIGSILVETDKGDYVWVKPEPNEPTIELVTYSTVPTSKGAIWLESENIPPPSIFYYDGEKTIEYIPKPEEKLYVTNLAIPQYINPMECESFNCITQFIPTWPDYIKLGKDLVIDMSHKNDPNDPTCFYWNYIISKGTKIYFKED